MPISLKTHKKLWGHSANRCAFDSCRKELTVDTFDTDDYYTIGDEAHIISEKLNGPRYDHDFPLSRIDKYDNLILVCKEHHKRIDSDFKSYSIDRLRIIKMSHEEWVRSNLNPDSKQQKEDELFADYIDQIQELANFDNWVDWTGNLLGASFTKIEKIQYDKLVELHKYICGRMYPETRLNLRNAIEQFNEVLEDFINEFELYKISDTIDNNYYKTERLYKLETVTVEQQVLHENMLEEFIIELTKAGNYFCEQVRNTIFQSYRLKQGILLLRDAPIMGIAYRRFEYKNSEKYCGFSEVRERTQKRLGQR